MGCAVEHAVSAVSARRDGRPRAVHFEWRAQLFGPIPGVGFFSSRCIRAEDTRPGPWAHSDREDNGARRLVHSYQELCTRRLQLRSAGTARLLWMADAAIGRDARQGG